MFLSILRFSPKKNPTKIKYGLFSEEKAESVSISALHLPWGCGRVQVRSPPQTRSPPVPRFRRQLQDFSYKYQDWLRGVKKIENPQLRIYPRYLALLEGCQGSKPRTADGARSSTGALPPPRGQANPPGSATGITHPHGATTAKTLSLLPKQRCKTPPRLSAARQRRRKASRPRSRTALRPGQPTTI